MFLQFKKNKTKTKLQLPFAAKCAAFIVISHIHT